MPLVLWVSGRLHSLAFPIFSLPAAESTWLLLLLGPSDSPFVCSGWGGALCGCFVAHGLRGILISLLYVLSRSLWTGWH